VLSSLRARFNSVWGEHIQLTASDFNLETLKCHTAPDNIQEQPQQDQNFVPSLAEIRLARILLRNFVPTELADMILHHAGYYHVISIRTHAPLKIVDRETHRADTSVLSLPFDDPGRHKLLQFIVRVSVVIEGHDQGWSGFPADRGTVNNSWTWYTIGTADPQTHEERLATNLHAVRATQRHAFEWDRDSTLVNLIREEGVVQVWAHAR
jgi:hypothetical protein